MPPLKWSRTCVICKTSYSRSEDGKRKFMTKFPLEYNRCREWLKIIGMPNLVSMPVEKLHHQKYVCGDHFEDKYFNKKKTRLIKLAVPTLRLNSKPLTEAILAHFPTNSTSTKINRFQPSVSPGRSSRLARENPGSALNATGTKMKVETQVCAGCLSMGRQCLITDVTFMKNLCAFPLTDGIMLCWECRALIRKILLFQRRVQVAGRVLQQSSEFNPVPQSTLVSIHKDTFDLVINENDEENENIKKLKIKVEKPNDNDEIHHDDLTLIDNSDVLNDNSDEFNDDCDEFNVKSDVISDNSDVLNDNSNEFNDKRDEHNDKSVELNDNSGVNKKTKKIKRIKKVYVLKRCKNYTLYKVDHKKYKSFMIKIDVSSEEAFYTNNMDKSENYGLKCMVCLMELDTLEGYQNHMIVHNTQNPVPQSTLVSIHKDTFDLVINENDEENENIKKLKIKVEKPNDNDEIHHDDLTLIDNSDVLNDNSDEFNDDCDEFNVKSDVISDNSDVLNDNSNEFNDKRDEHNDKSVELNDNSGVNKKTKKIKRIKKVYVLKRCKNYTLYKVDHKKYKSFMIKIDVSSEEAFYTNNMDKSENYGLKCMVCLMELDTLEGYQNHMIVHNTQAEIDNCKDLSKDDSNLHIEKPCVLYKCNLCKTDFANEKMFQLHFGEHKTLYKCNHCKVQFDSEASVTQHHSEIHTKCICDYCGNEYRTKGRLIQHMENHKKQECDICKRNFATREHLGRHKLNIHGLYKWRPQPKPEETYCVECDKHFVSIHALRKHLYSSIKHGAYKQKSVACPECGKVFARMSYMKNHFRLYHSEENKFLCNLCGKRFVSAFTLRQHGQLVHEKLQRPKDKICDACGRGFATNRTLVQHIRIHTGERPYPCSLCPARFRQKYSAQIHFRSQHANKNLHC